MEIYYIQFSHTTTLMHLRAFPGIFHFILKTIGSKIGDA